VGALRIVRLEVATMPIFIPPLLGWALGALGAAVIAKVLAREWRRVNDELHGGGPPRETPAPEKIPVLRRDPKSGIYQPE
jgi:hypothetical protein